MTTFIIIFQFIIIFLLIVLRLLKKTNTGLLDVNGDEAIDGGLIFKQGKPFELYEVYWDEQFQWSYRNHPKNIYGYKNFCGRLTSSKFIVPEDLKWELLKD
jgi:hypothetical protein